MTLTYDTKAPAAPVFAAYSYPGPLRGTAEAGTTVTVFRDSTALGSATPDPLTGDWSYAFTDANRTTLGSTANAALTAKATDAAGNSSVASSPLTIRRTSTSAADVLTGIAATDVFTLGSLANSRLASYDTIVGYVKSQRLDSPATSTASTLSASAGELSVAGLSDLVAKGSSITALLQGKLPAGGAAAFLVRDSLNLAVLGSAVAINDGTAGFSPASDALIFLQGYSVSATNTISVI